MLLLSDLLIECCPMVIILLLSGTVFFNWPGAANRTTMLEQLGRLAKELFTDLGRLLRRLVRSEWFQRWYLGGLRVGVVDSASESFASEDDHQSVFLDRSDEDFDSGYFDRIEFLAESLADIAGDPAGSAVGDESVFVDAAEVASDGDVIGSEFEVDTQCFENASADVVFQRVVAKEAKVTGPASGRNPWQHRDTASGFSDGCQLIEVWRIGCFEFRSASGFQRQSAQSIGDQQYDFRTVIFLQSPGEVVDACHRAVRYWSGFASIWKYSCLVV